MPTLLNILAGLVNVGGVLATLILLVFCMAAGANSTPHQLRTLKAIMLASALVGLVCLIASIWLIVARRPGPGAVVAALPVVVTVGVLTVMFLTEF